MYLMIKQNDHRSTTDNEILRKELPEMKLFTMVYLYSEHYESFYHESEEAHFVLRTEHSG